MGSFLHLLHSKAEYEEFPWLYEIEKNSPVL